MPSSAAPPPPLNIHAFAHMQFKLVFYGTGERLEMAKEEIALHEKVGFLTCQTIPLNFEFKQDVELKMAFMLL